MPSEQETAKWYQWPVYSWVSPLLIRGSLRMQKREKLETEDLLDLPTFETPSVNADHLKAFWEEELTRPQPSLARALRRAFYPRVMLGGLLRFTSDFSAFAAPFILREHIAWLQDPTEPIWKGFVFVIALTVANVVMSSCLNAGSHHTITAFTQMSTGLQCMIYNKALDLDSGHQDTGLVTSLHTTDAARFIEMAMFIHGLWVSPLLVIAATIALWFFIGYAGIIAVGIMIFFVPVQMHFMRKIYQYRGAIIKQADKRVSAVNEALQGIRICKFMNWENRFINRICSARLAEVAIIKAAYHTRAIVAVVTQSIPQIVMFALFGIAYGMGDGIAAKDVFPALSMLNVIRIPMMFIPMSIAKIFELKFSVERIQKLLLREPRKLEYLTPEDPTVALGVEDLTVLKSDKEDAEALLTVDKLEVPKGKLSVIIGPTGSGKSTLVAGLMGEVNMTDKAKIYRQGTIAYVSQEAWIMNGTLRANIIMDNPFDEDLYHSVIAACQLVDDLQQLPGGDLTEIGERGINLSGGQKQRIAFARAVYSDRDIVIMDDPLSAVDAHVCRALFDECICGVLASKTRLLVTHQVQFLPRADMVIEMKDCAIDTVGSPKCNESPTGLSPEPSPMASPSSKKDSKAALSSGKLTEKEEVFFGNVAWDVYLWYIRLGKFGWAAATIVAFLLWRASTVMMDLWLAFWTAREEPFGQTYSGNDYLMVFGILVVISIIFLYIRQLMYAKFMVNVATNCHENLIRNVVRAPTSFFDTTPMGRILNRFTKDIDILDTKVPEMVQMVVQLAMLILGMLFLVAYSAPYILVIMPLLMVMYVSMYHFYSETMRGVKRIEGVARSPMMAIMSETLGGLPTIRAYGLTGFFMGIHNGRAAAATRPLYCQRACQRWLAARTELIGSVILFGTGYLGAMSKSLGDRDWNVQVEPSIAALSLVYALATTNTITFLTRMMADLESDMSSSERIQEYSTMIPQERDVDYDRDSLPAPPAEWPQKGALTFESASLRYRDGLPLVLKQISLSISGGSKVGIVGRTGSGKSTIMLALFRMVELAEGSISIDGMDIANTKLSDLRNGITIIPQDPVLFEGSMRSNLDPFDQYEDEELWRVLGKVGMDERIKSEAEGLDCPVKEKGANFSVGQRQLLCLGRALLKKCKVLLMDEATASVDFESDALIQRTIREEFANCTVLTIAHRLATIIDSDKVLVLGAGEVLEFDSPSSLLKNTNGNFHSMVSELGEEIFNELVAKAAAANSQPY